MDENIKELTFFKELSKIENISDNNEYLAIIVYKNDKSLFNNPLYVSIFVTKKIRILETMKKELTYQEYWQVRKNLKYIENNPRIYPKLIKTYKPNEELKRKYHEDVYALYVTYEGQKEVLSLIANIMEKNNYSSKCAKNLSKQYGLNKKEAIYELLNGIYKEYELEVNLIKTGIKPNTSDYAPSKTKKYALIYQYKILLDKLINIDDKKEIEKILEEFLQIRFNIYPSYTNNYTIWVKHVILNISKLLYNRSEYNNIFNKLNPLFEQEEKNKRENIKNQALLSYRTKSSEVLTNAIAVIEKYLSTKTLSNEEELVNSLAVIKHRNNDLYKSYMKKIYGRKAKDVIKKFIDSEHMSLHQFLYEEHLSFSAFNRYRTLIEEDLDSELTKKLKNDSLETYKIIVNLIKSLLNQMGEMDYASALKLMVDNKIIPETVISILHNLMEKNKDNQANYMKLTDLEKYLKKYLDDIKKYPINSDKLKHSIESYKSYGNVFFDDNVKEMAIEYLEKEGIPITYLTVRSVLIRYANYHSFDKEAKIK